MKTYKLSPTVGTIPPDKTVGRKRDIQRLKKTLESQSVIIEEVRRMGKTLFLKKYAYQSTEKQKVLYFTLQGKKDVNEVIDTLIGSLREEQSFGKLKIAWDSVRKLYNNVKPDEVDISAISFKLPAWKTKWKEALTACLNDIAKRDKTDDETLVIILDELPIMVWDWIENGKAQQAKEFLDVLRMNRQLLEETGKIRIVICGSIGMQVVLKKLKEEHAYTGEPFNDMFSFSIGAMEQSEAYFLCECLFLDDFRIVNDENKADLLNQICQLSECLPFYINILFSIIRNEMDNNLSKDNIDKAYYMLLNEPQYNKVLKQLEERIRTYYSNEEASVMTKILDVLSISEDGVNEKDIIKALKVEKKILKESLYTLHSENYLAKEFKNDTNYYSYKYNLVKKWWRINMA